MDSQITVYTKVQVHVLPVYQNLTVVMCTISIIICASYYNIRAQSNGLSQVIFQPTSTYDQA